VSTCERCNEIVEPAEVEREDGSYHDACYADWLAGEQAYWSRQYNSGTHNGGYEWNDYKNPEYIERVLDSVDSEDRL
jgi:hypothetical protein